MSKSMHVVAALFCVMLGVGAVVYQRSKCGQLAAEADALQQLRKDTVLAEGSGFNYDKEEHERVEQFEKFDRERHGGKSSISLYEREVDRMKFYLAFGVLMWVIAGYLWCTRNARARAQASASSSS